MLKRIAAALIATSMVAGTAFAAAPSDNSASPPAAAASVNGKAAAVQSPHKSPKHFRHARRHERKHFARTSHRGATAGHQVYRGRTPKGRVAHATNRAKIVKAPKSTKTVKIVKPVKTAKTAGAQPTKLPATRTN